MHNFIRPFILCNSKWLTVFNFIAGFDGLIFFSSITINSKQTWGYLSEIYASNIYFQTTEGHYLSRPLTFQRHLSIQRAINTDLFCFYTLFDFCHQPNMLKRFVFVFGPSGYHHQFVCFEIIVWCCFCFSVLFRLHLNFFPFRNSNFFMIPIAIRSLLNGEN